LHEGPRANYVSEVMMVIVGHVCWKINFSFCFQKCGFDICSCKSVTGYGKAGGRCVCCSVFSVTVFELQLKLQVFKLFFSYSYWFSYLMIIFLTLWKQWQLLYMFGTLAVYGCAVTFGTAKRGLGGLWPRPGPSLLYRM